ncbi:ATP-binding protein [Paenibacillus abyssi]|uniref:histidine kinase n=1 Tax=Paenibacillus abyssi TaxID=1340531 RepID=A0A917FYH3_9BACL|nr:sensor histidine kinase [Paenibacillus abyssi]GGG14214.1 two-component sensor histidine kinase [Paenibacillus abyssi]
MDVIKDFVLQLMFVAIPLFFYHTFFTDRLINVKYERVIMIGLWGISTLLCMTFPASFGPDYRLDIRIIPLLLGTMYGGVSTALFISAVLILYRMYIGIDLGLYTTIFTVLCGVPVFMYFQRTFDSAKKRKRVKIAVLLVSYYILIGLVWTLILRGFSIETFKIQMIHLVFVAVITWFFTVLNENIREIHQLRIEIQNSEKQRIVSDLTSVFAHEIRNPMQVTRGFLQLLNEPGLSEKKREYIHISIEELDRANDIINDLLSLGKPPTNDMQGVDAGHQLGRVIQILETYAAFQDVTIISSIDKNCWVLANAQKLNQCLINIIKNAIESMPTGGVIHATCTSTEDGYIEIMIKDQGVGMTREQIERLGSPFYSLKESGTGLGMMVSYQIIRSFKGKVLVHSEKNIGTKFIILLPSLKHDY